MKILQKMDKFIFVVFLTNILCFQMKRNPTDLQYQIAEEINSGYFMEEYYHIHPSEIGDVSYECANQMMSECRTKVEKSFKSTENGNAMI